MPVRSLSSSVLKWSNAEAVDQSVRRWAQEIAPKRPEIIRIGYFGSYARGDWGIGSDLDIVVVVERAELPLIERAREWDVTELPVPADLLIYTEKEWESLAGRGRFGEMLQRETAR